MSINGNKLPTEFADLEQFASRFAISDDLLRDESSAEADASEKHRFVEAIKPRFETINAYLDLHDHEDDERVHTLGRLAEAACELMLELQHEGRN